MTHEEEVAVTKLMLLGFEPHRSDLGPCLWYLSTGYGNAIEKEHGKTSQYNGWLTVLEMLAYVEQYYERNRVL